MLKPTRERVDSKGLCGRWRLHLMGSWLKQKINCQRSGKVNSRSKEVCTIYLEDYTPGQERTLFSRPVYTNVVEVDFQKVRFNSWVHILNVLVPLRGDGQNTDPQSMNYPDRLPKWTTSTLSNLHCRPLYVPLIRLLGAILNNRPFSLVHFVFPIQIMW